MQDINYSLFNLMCIWHRDILDGKTIKKYLQEYGYENVVIYGMGKVGILLLQELFQSGVNVIYCIDKNAPMIYAENSDVILPEDILYRTESADVVIVTAIGAYEQVRSELTVVYNCPVVSFEDMLLDL